MIQVISVDWHRNRHEPGDAAGDSTQTARHKRRTGRSPIDHDRACPTLIVPIATKPPLPIDCHFHAPTCKGRSSM